MKTKEQNCEHERTNKLFYFKNQRWNKTDYAICLECGAIVKVKTTKEVID